MDKFIASLLAVMTVSSPAIADQVKVTVGWLTGFNVQADEVYLDDGKTYHAPPQIDFSVLNPGERYLVEFTQSPARKKIVVIIPVPVMDERRLTSANDKIEEPALREPVYYPGRTY